MAERLKVLNVLKSLEVLKIENNKTSTEQVIALHRWELVLCTIAISTHSHVLQLHQRTMLLCMHG